MKTNNFITFISLSSLLLALFLWSTPMTAQTEHPSGRYDLIVTGTVRDKDSGKKLENVTVSLEGTTIGTVTNADGYYSLKFSRGVEPVLNFSHLGYESQTVAAVETSADQYAASIKMMPTTTELDEAVIFGDPRGLVEEALRKIPNNYPTTTNLLNAFYRETVQKRHRYVCVSEAVLDVYKTSYTRRSAERDAVGLLKARRLMSQKAGDTLGVKIAGGPNLALIIDFVKNADVLFDETSLDYYSFSMLPNEKIDDRVQYVVAFAPRVSLNYALYIGKVYIDKEGLYFTRAEFSLDLSSPEKASSIIIYKKPAGLNFLPLETSFLVSYRNQDGVTRLNYISSEMRFKCDLKRLGFSSAYVARTETVVVEREDREEVAINRKSSFRQNEVFYDMVQEYWDEDYWKGYNIIEPTESLENAVKRLKRKQ